MTNGTVQFWWAVRAFASALLGACLFAAALLLWNMENLLWGGGVLSTIGALAGSWAGWRLCREKGQKGRVEAMARPIPGERYSC